MKPGLHGFLLSSAVAVLLCGVSTAALAQTEVDNGFNNVATDDFAGLIESDDPANAEITLDANNDFMYFGWDVTPSLTINNAGKTLTVNVINSNPVGGATVFAGDVVEQNGDIVMNLKGPGTTAFQRNVGAVVINAGNSVGNPTTTTMFTITSARNNTIDATIDAVDAADISNVIIRNEDATNTNTFTFNGDIGSNVAVDDITVGSNGTVLTNNVIFRGNIRATTLTFGDPSGAAETNNVTIGSLTGDTQVQATIIGDDNANDTNNLTFAGGHTVTVTGPISEMDNITVNALTGLTVQNNIASVAVTNNGTLTMASGTTMTAGTMSGTGTYVVTLADPATHSTFDITAGAIDLTGATIQANVLAPNAFSNGNKILLGQGTAALVGFDGNTGLGPSDITANTALWNFQVADGTHAGGNNTQLYMLVNSLQTLQQAGAGASPNNQSVGLVLDGLQGTTDPELSTLMARLNAATDTQTINNILAASLPAADNGVTTSTVSLINTALNLNSMRLDSLRGVSGIATGNDGDGLRVWMQTFGHTGRQGIRDNIAGYDSSTWGMTVGADTEDLVQNAVVGVSGSYGSTDIDSDNITRTNADVESYQLSVYGDYDLTDRVFINALAAYSRNNIRTARYNVAGVTGANAYGEFDANQYAMRAETGYDYINGNFSLTPTGLIHWTHYSAEDYREKGVGGIGLHVDQDTQDIFELGGALAARWKFQHVDGISVEPEMRAGYRYDLVGDSFQTTSSFVGGGATFRTVGADPARGTLNLGTGVKMTTVDGWEFTANYDFEHKSDYLAHSGFLRAGYQF